MTLLKKPFPMGLRYVGVGAAGLLTFAVAFQLSRSSVADDGDGDLLVRSKHEVGSNVMPTQLAAVTSEEAMGTRWAHARLRHEVLKDAFAPLNTSITIEQLTAPPEPPPPVRRKSVKVAAAPIPTPPAPPTPVIVEPPPPTAPPLPFRVVGTLHGDQIGGGELTAFLASGNAASTLVVKAGDIINGTYKVTELTDRQISFTYLPLQTQQSLRIDR